MAAWLPESGLSLRACAASRCRRAECPSSSGRVVPRADRLLLVAAKSAASSRVGHKVGSRSRAQRRERPQGPSVAGGRGMRERRGHGTAAARPLPRGRPVTEPRPTPETRLAVMTASVASRVVLKDETGLKVVGIHIVYLDNYLSATGQTPLGGCQCGRMLGCGAPAQSAGLLRPFSRLTKRAVNRYPRGCVRSGRMQLPREPARLSHPTLLDPGVLAAPPASRRRQESSTPEAIRQGSNIVPSLHLPTLRRTGGNQIPPRSDSTVAFPQVSGPGGVRTYVP